jgi:hypothetical protein
MQKYTEFRKIYCQNASEFHVLQPKILYSAKSQKTISVDTVQLCRVNQDSYDISGLLGVMEIKGLKKFTP